MNTSSITIPWSIAEAEAAAAGFPVILPAHFWMGCTKACDLDLTEFLVHAPTEVRSQSSAINTELAAIRQAFLSSDLNPTLLRRTLRKHLGQGGPSGRVSDRPLHRDPELRAAFAKGKAMADMSGDSFGPAHVLFILLQSENPSFDATLRALGADRDRLQSALVRIVLPEAAGENAPGAPVVQPHRQDKPEHAPVSPTPPENSDPTALERFGRDLCALARAGKLAPVIGRKPEMLRMAQALLQSRKSNVILVGEPGVGKTGIVEGLAQRIVDGQVPEELRSTRIVELSLSLLVAGTKYRGEFEKRMQAVIQEASEEAGVILFLDEIHTLMGAGQAGGSMDAANILKPALARGALRVFGATTTKEYRQHIEKDAALARRFQTIEVEEPTPEETLEILHGLRSRMEEHHGLTITEEALRAAVEWSVRYLPDFRLPDKAIDLLDTACAQARFLTFSGVSHPQEVNREGIAAAVAGRCHIPVGLLTADENARLSGMEESLGRRVKGQEDAIRAVAEAVRLARSGLGHPQRPVGAFLFVGPSGTGKTELAKALTEFLFHDEAHLIRFDMSEFMEEHSVSKLIGAPPGYKGCDEEGQLVAQVRSHPYSVVLFDEIEKAHPRVLDVFLQILDEGQLTSANGRKCSFRHSVVLLTSNLGSRLVAAKKEMGFGAKEVSSADTEQRQREQSEHIQEAIKQHLRPELINRLSSIVVFHPLTQENIRAIVGKVLDSLNQRLRDRGITLSLSAEVIEWIVAEGFSPEYGARELERVMDRLLAKPLADAVLKGTIQAGQKVQALRTDGCLVFR